MKRGHVTAIALTLAMAFGSVALPLTIDESADVASGWFVALWVAFGVSVITGAFTFGPLWARLPWTSPNGRSEKHETDSPGTVGERLSEDPGGQILPTGSLREALRVAMDLRGSMSESDSDERASSFSDDPLRIWAKQTYQLIRRDFSEHADESWGPELVGLGPAYFGTAFSAESNDLNKSGRRGYLERRIALLRRIIEQDRA